VPVASFLLNGRPTRVDARSGESLLDVLRNRCGITSIKDGCQPQGQCGCCLVLIDGKPKVSCATAVETAAGREITTIEGVPEEEQRLLAKAFVAAAGVQCGFCIPGIALRAHWLVGKNPSPSRDEITRLIDGHVCRCTGYVKIIDAIELFARARRGETILDAPSSGGVGARVARYRGDDLVLGKKEFAADLLLDGMLHAAVALSPHARARVLRIDTTKAKAHPGVVAVATADDVPGKRFYGLLHDDWPGFVAVGEETRYVGDVIAAVAASDEHTAREAAKLVEVDYDVLPPVLSTDDGDMLSRTTIVRGDVDAALAASAHVVRGTWTTQRIEHAFLEPESAVAEPLPDRKLRVVSGGQGVFDDRRQIAAFLDMPIEDVVVEQLTSGGAFGGKEDLSIQAHAALLARMTRRPVKLTLSREESVRMHPKRHPMTMRYEVGCEANGRLTAVRSRIAGDTGAYASVGEKVLERAAGHACGAYDVANVDVESLAVKTNNPPSGAMRGFGANQTNFAIEGCVDKLADLCGIDRWEIRWRNALDVGGTFTTGQLLTKSVGLKKTLLAVRAAYDDAKQHGRSVGIACGVKNSGLGNGAREVGRARLVVEQDGTISLYNGFSEVGQGLLTILTQIAVEITGIDFSHFRAKVDTRYALDSGQTTGSRATLLSGRAVADAARKLKKDLDEVRSQKAEGRSAPLRQEHREAEHLCPLPSDFCLLTGRHYEGETVIDDTTPIGSSDAPKTHTAFAFATQLCILDERGRVERVVAAHDVGRAINPAFCEGQIEGSVHMGLGYALTEELPCPDGMPVTHKLLELGVLRATDMPAVDVILVEDPEPEGPFGAKGLGEIGLVPTAAAVAGALKAFDGIRRTTLPMKDSPAARVLRAGHIRVAK